MAPSSVLFKLANLIDYDPFFTPIYSDQSEYRTIYLKKVDPDGRKANCLFSKQNSEHM